ncbi:hypothetical protein B0A52_00025 [Exophiala mesophila]|uniref:Succinate dehydrogenase assembly factor 4, mitochondrial n=1 Tax=Exophiala mesophila TaxID=212818 RepID=A0A438NIV3_EXOME|nr:hypothetical protein B0A52_00025 [Exophiala mesophila]
MSLGFAPVPVLLLYFFCFTRTTRQQFYTLELSPSFLILPMASASVSARVFNAAPRAHLFSRNRNRSTCRLLCTSAALRDDSKKQASSSASVFPSVFGTGPSPPRLPKEDQEIFEALQRQSTGAFSTPRTPPRINQSPHSTPPEVNSAQQLVKDRVNEMGTSTGSSKQALRDEFQKMIEARGNGDELHADVRRGAKPEFEGDVNPKTGEVGGPKNEPLRWGASGEWSYNGRTTDF